MLCRKSACSALRSIYSSVRWQTTVATSATSTPADSTQTTSSVLGELRHALKTRDMKQALDITLATNTKQLEKSRIHVDVFRQAMKSPDSATNLRALYEKYMSCGVRIGWMCAAVIIKDISQGNADRGLKTWVEFLESLGNIMAMSNSANVEATWAALAAYVASCHASGQQVDAQLAIKLVPTERVPFPEELLQIQGYKQINPDLRNAIADGLRKIRVAKADPNSPTYIASLPSDRPLELDQMYLDCKEKARESASAAAADVGGAPKVELSEAFYARVMSCYAVSSRPNSAFNVWNDMIESGIEPSILGYNALLKTAALSKADRESTFKAVWEKLQAATQPDSESYSILINFLFKQRQPEKAIAVFDKVRANEFAGVSTTLWMFNVVLDGLLENNLVAQAEQLVETGAKTGLTPTVVSYNALIRTYLKRSEYNKASEAFDKMVATGVTPDVVTYTNIIDTVFKFSQTQGIDPTSQVEALLSEMIKSKIKVNAVTLTAILSGLAKAGSDVECSRLIFDLMIKKNIRPNARTFGSLVDFELKYNNFDKALDYFNMMPRFGIPRGTPMYNQLIHWAAHNKYLDEAYRLFEKLSQSSRTKPNKFTYFFMLDGCYRSKNKDIATGVLNQMSDYTRETQTWDMGTSLPKLIPRLSTLGVQIPTNVFELAEAQRGVM